MILGLRGRFCAEKDIIRAVKAITAEDAKKLLKIPPGFYIKTVSRKKPRALRPNRTGAIAVRGQCSATKLEGPK